MLGIVEYVFDVLHLGYLLRCLLLAVALDIVVVSAFMPVIVAP